MGFHTYDFMFSEEALRRFFKHKAKPVRHQQTCPMCGRKLVNLYRKGETWKCKLCWEKEGENE